MNQAEAADDSPDLRSGRRLVARARRRLLAGLALANVIGTLVVVACIFWVVPGPPPMNPGRTILYNAVTAAIFFVVVIPTMVLWGEAWLRSGRRWLQEGRPPTEREVIAVLHAPIRLFTVQLTAWLIATIGFSLLNALTDFELFTRVAFTILLGGLTTSAFTYLLAEQVTRPLAAEALSVYAVDKPKLPGVVTRTLIAWALGSGVPLFGLAITGLFGLVRPRATVTQMAMTMLVVGMLGLVAGAWIAILGARGVALPVKDLRRAIAELADGDYQSRADVYDGSVLGLLQVGFNQMATGLEERERLRDLYGRQVGIDVAAEALERGGALGGDTRLAAVMFVDVVGSTDLASSRPAKEVVSLLNAFFGVVVSEVHEHGGWINKFQGDATLAVFGVPAPLEDPAGRALAAARAVARRLPEELSELGAGIGVAYGTVVAGNVGDESRFEFTVIGDPVNEAARLTELSKSYEPMILASADVLRAAGTKERENWSIGDEVTLRGRTKPTRLARPASVDSGT